MVAPYSAMDRTEIGNTCIARLRGIVHVYGKPPHRVQVLHGIDLDICSGEMTLIRGHSGSGKSTLLSILGLLMRPTRGSVELCARALSDLGERELTACRREQVSFVFQGFNLLSALTAAENVQVGLVLQGAEQREAEAGAMELLERVGLGDRSTHRPRQLSCGQQQRVAIARALASPAPLLLADEPTANLDSRNAAQVSELLRELAHEDRRAVVAVTHDPRMQAYADRVIDIADGKVTGDERGGRQ